MKKQKFILPIAVLLVMAVSITFVSAAVLSNVSGIIDHSNYTSATIICATQNDSDDCHNCRNATIWYNATGGDVEDIATAEVLCTIQSAGAITTTNTLDFTSTSESSCGTAFEALNDALTYNFTCTFGNATEYNVVNATDNAGASLGARSSVGVDNTLPVVTVSTDYTSVNLGRYFKYTTVVTDATAGLTTSYCNLTDPDGNIDVEGTISTSETDTEYQQTSTAGDYVLSCTGTDSAGNTKTTTETVTSKTSGSPITSAPTVSAAKGFGGLTNQQLIIGVIVIALAIMAINGKK